MNELLPTVQAERVREALLDYLGTTFTLADDDARESLEDFLADPDDGIFKGPYLRLRLPFRPAEDGWRRHLDWYAGFPPYGHQAATFARLTSADLGPDKPRPLPTVVTTGTGSGKTEAFLYPILDHVLRAKRAGVSGTKALLLYPMNALANDQAGRIADLLTTHEALAGVTAALYTGQDDKKRSKVTRDSLITDRAVIRSAAPDILLTNYKMLDQLLLRPDDAPIWRQSAESLQYLVLDEFHTYDGAQGTDVAMLLRRLGLALKHYWTGDSDVTDDDRARPLGKVTPVATSATLGDRDDPAAMLDFAETVFGETFPDDAVVTETRLTYDDWAGGADATLDDLTAREIDTFVIDGVNAAVEQLGRDADGSARAEAVLAVLYADEEGTHPDLAGTSDDTLLVLVKAHPLTERLVAATDQAAAVRDLTQAVGAPESGPATTDSQAAQTFLRHYVAALSHVRAVCGRDALGIDLHLWVRELTRIDRAVAPSVRLRWSDDGEVVDQSETDDAPGFVLPALYCRHCGRSGWGASLAPTGRDLDDAEPRQARAGGSERFRPLLYAPAEGDRAIDGEDVPELQWLDVRERRLAGKPGDDGLLREGRVLPVLTHMTDDAAKLSVNDTCPSCQMKDGIRFLGSAIATLLSVSLSTLFGAPGLDAREKKALIFTDSVQDAAHRAGFVESRSHSLTMRSVLRDAIGDTPINLEDLVTEIVTRAGDDAHHRFRIMPPDLTERPEFAEFWQSRSRRAVPADVSRRVRKRLLLDIVLEFGLQSGVGRTLELTGSVAAEVSVAEGTLVLAADRALDEFGGPLDGTGSIDRAPKVAWVRGVLERMRQRGAIEHEWFRRYIKSDGNRYSIWGGRPREEGMPAFPRGRAAPGYPRIGGKQQRDSDLDSVTATQSWYAHWTARTLGIPAAEGAKLARLLLQRLAHDRVIGDTKTDSGAYVYHLASSSVLVQPVTTDVLTSGTAMLACNECGSPVPGTPTVIAQLDGAPCTVVRCAGKLGRVSRADNFYRQLYASTDIHRVVAREHTSLLDDEERLAYENGFKAAQDDPKAPNVLVATPTLEMGIDIGDLSTVMLASLPRSVANYLQRVGRAGRLTGNALNLAYVRGRGEQLPRLGDPLSVVNGQVRPPATYLEAEEILRRQYLAAVIDHRARVAPEGFPRATVAALGSIDDGTWLESVMTEAESHAEDHLAAFLAGFPDLRGETSDALRVWATPADGPGTSGLAGRLREESRRWRQTEESLRFRYKEIEESLPELQQKADSPAATDDDKRDLRSAQAAARLLDRQRRAMRTDPWVSGLEAAGLLPNYTLLDDSVTLDVALSWFDPTSGEYRTEPDTVERPSARALRELAPGATFYARGRQVTVDAIDLGTEGEAIRTVVVCPACGYVEDVSSGDRVGVCPRCRTAAIADTRQRLDVVELERVSAAMQRDETVISDARDERKRERFVITVAADIDPSKVTRRWYVDGYPFGVKHVRDLTLRWFNLGRRTAHAGQRTIAGRELTAAAFRVCSACGKVDTSTRANSRAEHRPWCSLRNAHTEDVRTIALGRTLRTEGIVLRLPATVTLADAFAQPSLRAALLAGLRERIGGNPDHLQIESIVDPNPDDEVSPDALLLHDIVPGGTGYLAELADPEIVWAVLHEAWGLVRDCECQHEQRLACHRCLLPFAPPGDEGLISRSAAERHLRTVLTSGNPDAEPADVMSWRITSEAPPPSDPESTLEQRFRKVFAARLETVGASIHDQPGPRGNRSIIRIGGSGAVWRLEPQQNLLDSKPDFVLRCDRPDVPEIAIFTDGWQFHAAPGSNRLADDAAKRQNLRESGRVVVSVCWDDLERAEHGITEPPPWLEPSQTGEIMRAAGALSPASVDLLGGGPIDYLVRWVQDPEREAMATLAQWLPYFFAARARPLSVADGDSLADAAISALDGRRGWATEQTPAWAWTDDTMIVAARGTGEVPDGVDVALVLDDRDGALGKHHQAAWRHWLGLSNLLNLRRTGVQITTVTAARRGLSTVASGVPATDGAGLSNEWRAVYDVAADDQEQALIVELAAHTVDVPVPGLEVVDGIPIDMAWASRRVAALYDADNEVRRELEAAGWRVVSADAESILAALESEGT